ncbi:class I SAM-dependent methyltransferase [uncultured Friedmanniella sp.]|uniref:class I SAM-dependent methyltransferase n=1 Tax=uncultured Friedmanniella sp. TaxID=335381 RepID=UPI0035CC04B1
MTATLAAGPDLRHRETAVVELMDDPDCDLVALRRTYGRFALVNRLVASWHRTYRQRVRPLLSRHRTSTLLDLGCGGGDLALALSRWARADGLRLDVVAVDPDPRAYAFVSERPPTPGVRFRLAGSADLVAQGERYDILTSNHLLHHLTAAELAGVLADTERLTDRLALHSDLRRSRTAYAVWAATSWPAAADSFLFTDGLLSIRRSYAPAELAAVVPIGWRVQRQEPFRLLLSWSTGVAHG